MSTIEQVQFGLEIWTIVQCLAGFLSIFFVCCRVCQTNKKVVDLPTCVLVVPMYLPNEEKIAFNALKHAAKQNVNRIHIVFNTPHDMPKIETELQELARNLSTSERPINVTRVLESVSKAANLNYAVNVATESHMLIYDVDHRIINDGCTLLRQRLASHEDALGVSGVLGIRGDGCFDRFLDAMEWSNWVLFMTMQSVFIGSYIFGGSNAIWHTDVLRELLFDEKLLLEDMDITIRALCKYPTRSLLCERNARCTELSASGFRALWNQRMRWMMGWEQLAWCRFYRVVKKRPRMIMIWVFRYASLIAACVTITRFLYEIVSSSQFESIPSVQSSFVVSVPIKISLAIVSIVTYVLLVITWIFVQCETFARATAILLFTASSPILIYAFVIMNFISIIRIHCTSKSPTWIVTTRSNEPNLQQTKTVEDANFYKMSLNKIMENGKGDEGLTSVLAVQIVNHT